MEVSSPRLFEEQPRNPRRLREEAPRTAGAQSELKGLWGNPCQARVWSPGKAHGTVRLTGVPGEGMSSLLLLGKHSYAPLGMGWLLPRQLRAQHKKAAILLDQLASSRNKAVSPSVLF